MSLMEYYNNNQDRIEEAFDNHISYMEDSYEHVYRVANSERYFWEFVEEMFDKEQEV